MMLFNSNNFSQGKPGFRNINNNYSKFAIFELKNNY